MASKGHNHSSQPVTTTPRRLRSGTPLGERSSPSNQTLIRHQSLSQSRKNVSERNILKSVLENKKALEIKNEDERILKHKKESQSNNATKCSKGHESLGSPLFASESSKQETHSSKERLYEENFSISIKTNKRKILRDLLNQTTFPDKPDPIKSPRKKATLKPSQDRKSSAKANSDIRPNANKERQQTNSTTQTCQPVDTGRICKSEKDLLDMAEMVPSKADDTLKKTSSYNKYTTVKQEMPDDYWPTRLNYIAQISKKPLVKVRIQTEDVDSDETHSQMHSSCCVNEKQGLPVPQSQTSFLRSGKPDIVLRVTPGAPFPEGPTFTAFHSQTLRTNQVVPRENNSKTISEPTSERESVILEIKNTPKKVSKMCIDSSMRNCTKIRSAKSDVKSLGDNSNANSADKHNHNESLYWKDKQNQTNPCKQKHSRENKISKANTHGHQLHQHKHNHQPVLDDTTLPSVDTTVEFFTQTDLNYLERDGSGGESDPSALLPLFGEPAQRKQMDFHDFDFHSPDPPVLEPITSMKVWPCENRIERITLNIKHEREDENSEENSTESANSETCNRGDTEFPSTFGTSPRALSLDATEEIETCSNAEDMAQVRSDMFSTVLCEREGKEGTCAASVFQEDTRSRRRRKGRPSRRAKTECSWSATELFVYAGEDSDSGEGSKHAGGSKHGVRQDTASNDGCCRVAHVRKTIGKRPGGSCNGNGRRAQKMLDLETLWANPELDTHAFLLWASENRREVHQLHPAASGQEIERLLAAQWRDVAFSSKFHFLCRARDAGTDQDRHTVRKKKASAPSPTTKREPAPADGRTVCEEFFRLPLERQKDLLRKWLRFFQKMLPRLEYQEFINDFKKACKNLQLRPITARRKNTRLRNLDPSHYKMLFEKIRETRPRVISVYNKRKIREDQLLRQSFDALVRRLIASEPWPFVRGCRSKVLGELLKDIQQLEVEEALAQIDLPLSLSPAQTQDSSFPKDVSPSSCTLLSPTTQDSASSPTAGHASRRAPLSVRAGNGEVSSCPSQASSFTPNTVAITNNTPVEPPGPEGDAELTDNSFVLNVLADLRHVTELPVLEQRNLDNVFLGPPSRARMSVPRESQFQNSVAYRRTLLYKHIQPLVDSRGLPLTSSALYHSHPSQYFFKDDR